MQLKGPLTCFQNVQPHFSLSLFNALFRDYCISVRKYKPFWCGVHHVDHVLCFLSGDNHLPLLYLRIISYLQFQPPVRPWGGSGWEVLSIPPGPWCVRRPLRVCVALHVAAFTTPLAPPGLDPWDLSTQPPEAGESKRNEDET